MVAGRGLGIRELPPVLTSTDSTQGPTCAPAGSCPPAERLHLYCRAAEALNGFFGRWTVAFCQRCLEVTARAHAGEAGAAMELALGQFAGCCQAGVAETLSVPCGGDAVPFPADLAVCMVAARAALGVGTGSLHDYTLRAPGSGRLVEGRGCSHLGGAGCRLGELKAPLCLTYVCAGIRAALEGVAGSGRCGDADENFCGAADALCAVIAEPVEAAERQVAALEARLQHLARRLEEEGVRTGQELLDRWLSPRQACGERVPV